MIRKIILENYMAHVSTVIEPAAGLTVLVGPNNCGKSAVAHALEMICYNSDAAGFAIRHGTKEASVTIETEDDDGTRHTLIWKRRKDTASYSIDGREMHKMGRGSIPDDLHRFLKMPEIEAATGDDFRIHFGLQKSPIFLLDGPARESRAAQFFASSSDADRLMEMQRRHKQKEAAAKRDKEAIDQEMMNLDRQLSDLAPLPVISKELALLDHEHAEIIAAENRLRELKRSIEGLSKAQEEAQAIQLRARSLEGLQSPPLLPAVEPLKNQINGIAQAAGRAAINRAMLDALVELKPAPALWETAGLGRLVDDLTTAQRRSQRESDRVRATNSLQPVPDRFDVESLSRTLEKLETLLAQVHQQHSKSAALLDLRDPPAVNETAGLRQRLAALVAAVEKVRELELRHRLLETLPAVPPMRDLTVLRELINRIGKAAQTVGDARRAIEKSERNLALQRAEIQRWVQDNPRCQSCGQSISVELVLTGEPGAHDHE